MRCLWQQKEIFQGNPVKNGNCPATVKGTKAIKPLSGYTSGWEGRQVGDLKRAAMP